MQLISFTVMAYFLACFLLIPFNYVTIYASKNNKKEYIYCEINSISNSRGRGVFSSLKGESNLINGYKPIMQKIIDKNLYDKYLLRVEVREGYLGTYILENWDFVEK